MLKDFKVDQNDFIIVVMGPTGSGKTNFINKLTGNSEKPAASQLRSDTQIITPYPIPYEDLRLVLVDTPGFDDTYRPDIETLQVVADWLIQKYPDGTTLKIAGVIYLHKINDNRVSGSVHKNLQIFSRLCGSRPLPRTRLVTTMWDVVNDQSLAVRRESQLTHAFWRELIDGGATVHRFDNTSDSAWTIVHDLLFLGADGDTLLLQEELVEQRKRLNETEAGKVLHTRLQKLLSDQRQRLQELADNAKRQKNPAMAKILQRECDQIDAQLQRMFEEMKEMKIPLSRHFYLWLFNRRSHSKPVDPDHARG